MKLPKMKRKQSIDVDAFAELAARVRQGMEEDAWTFDEDTGEITPPNDRRAPSSS